MILLWRGECHSRLAVLAGLEPTTRCLEGSCSVQMSYRTLLKFAGNYTILEVKGKAKSFLPRIVVHVCTLNCSDVTKPYP